MKIDINVDMGESFGRYTLGNDEEIMQYISSANIACGFHAGDPRVMAETVKFAKKYDIAVGAHTGLRDLQGFGRRRMEITPEELTSDTLYQLGALDAFLRVSGMKMQHIKPHGILYRMVAEEERYADALLDAITAYNPELCVLINRGSLLWEKGLARGLRMVAEILVDLSYDDEGNWVLERNKKARSSQEVAERSVMVAREGKIPTISGKLIEAKCETICLHGDAPNAVETAREVRLALNKFGITVKNLLS
jgi:5-oxoprolinase (ATP-hydrolysing) subunit A